MTTPTSIVMPELLSPCKKPGGCTGAKDCDEAHDCEHREENVQPVTPVELHGLAKAFRQALYRGIDLCLDDLPEEPTSMLIVGGARQRDLAQWLALMFPNTDMVVVDPDPEKTRLAQEEVCCRFTFVTAPLESLPFESDRFDVTIAHNLQVFVNDWTKASGELGRITRQRLLVGLPRPGLIRFLQGIPGLQQAMSQAFAADCLEVHPRQPVDRNEILREFWRYGKVKRTLTPWPWTLWMFRQKPDREERLILT